MDTSVLRKIVGDDEATVRELLALFLDTAGRQRAQMHAAGAADDARGADAVAHKLQSASRTVGAPALAALCAAIESAAKAGDLPALREHLAAFDLELERQETAIHAYLGNADNR